MGRLGTWSSRLAPRGWVDLARQFLLFGGAYYIYRLVRGLVDGHPNIAYQHARDIVYFERNVHAFFEPSLQHWAISHSLVINLADRMYVYSHFIVTTAFLVWLYTARNHAYYFVRNMFMMAMGFALVGYLVFPAAPPRYLPEWGFQDTVADFFGHASNAASVLYNPYAAMPSMHVCFSLLVAVPAIQLIRAKPLKFLWCFYPPLVTFVVISTANHFWLDGAVGAVIALLSALLARVFLARARPESWSWRTAPAEASI